MERDAIFWPMLALVALTLGVLLMIPFHRLRSGFRGEVWFDDFKLGESERVPDRVRLPNRNYMNLLELPLLFYVFCLASYVRGQVDEAAVTMAWIYVGLRVLHSAVHLSINHVPLRLIAFAASNVVLTLMWLRLALALAAA
ncbi:MAPEG family protein [Hydrocarboniphaga effusa]|jgi:hypothetical protein|uniref:MAPEG family protein n=1 Tax=Hydrocarboniphaga effusa TaxID=243629 RepID=UPI003137A9D1